MSSKTHVPSSQEHFTTSQTLVQYAIINLRYAVNIEIAVDITSEAQCYSAVYKAFIAKGGSIEEDET